MTYYHISVRDTKMTSGVAVVVLGDVGRSPRMQYHCISLASMQNTRVSLVGYSGEKCVPDVESNANITKYLISAPFANFDRRFFLLYAPFKVIFQILQLFWTLLCVIPRPRAILVQNPPSIPTLLVVWLVSRLRGAKMVIDWHNFGFTVLDHAGKNQNLVWISKVYEQFFANRADEHICVTQAMQQWLNAHWGIRARVLYDRPPPFFRKATVSETHDLFNRLKSTFQPSDSENGSTTLTAVVNGKPTLRADRPALIVSSTSWTEDEDFSILLNALILLDTHVTQHAGRYPKFLVAVTGKGPMKAYYEKKMADLDLTHIRVATVWLEPQDYPLILGSADLGICLHVSTSGLDLPMKVVDMYGTGLPVCAVGFSCLSELVKDGFNGMVFRDSSQLAGQLQELFDGFPSDPAQRRLAKLRAGVSEFQKSRWQDNWTANVQQIFVHG